MEEEGARSGEDESNVFVAKFACGFGSKLKDILDGLLVPGKKDASSLQEFPFRQLNMEVSEDGVPSIMLKFSSNQPSDSPWLSEGVNWLGESCVIASELDWEYVGKLQLG